jgi:hypothetical protein
MTSKFSIVLSVTFGSARHVPLTWHASTVVDHLRAMLLYASEVLRASRGLCAESLYILNFYPPFNDASLSPESPTGYPYQPGLWTIVMLWPAKTLA